MSEVHLPPSRAVLELLGRSPARVEALDPRGQPWLIGGDGWTAVLRRFPPERYPPEASFEHVAWLHRFLQRLAREGFPAPEPLPLLNGETMAVVDGAIWEMLSFVPGRPLHWNPGVPLESAGALLARFHQRSLMISPPDQRPDALPLEHCRPDSAKRIADSFHRELVDAGHQSARRCVLHGDCTVGNMLVDEHAQQMVGMIDFDLAHLGPPESDISFALWVTGRSAQPARTLDAARVRAFVAGYHRVRPLTDWSAKAIPLYLVGRGLQMLVRLERRGIHDDIQLDRLSWLNENRQWLQEVVSSALT